MCHNKSIIHDTGCSLSQRPTPTTQHLRRHKQRSGGSQRDKGNREIKEKGF
ncbi:unnamed protein product [Larinioides sclopetarius]|uniref:Uncharacterized protein n=1 Tax=Larinioides sclopetarius TaxID=280406 RepID=A0AAV2AYG6_9ARAC